MAGKNIINEEREEIVLKKEKKKIRIELKMKIIRKIRRQGENVIILNTNQT